MTTQNPEQTTTQRIVFDVDRDGWTKGLQLNIAQLDENGSGMGYRLHGPKYNGSSERLIRHQMDERDATEIRQMLDAVFPQSSDSERDRATRAAVLDEVAEALEARRCSPESIALVRRLVNERLCTDCKGRGQTVSLDQDGGVVRRCRSCNREGLRRQIDADEGPVR